MSLVLNDYLLLFKDGTIDYCKNISNNYRDKTFIMIHKFELLENLNQNKMPKFIFGKLFYFDENNLNNIISLKNRLQL